MLQSAINSLLFDLAIPAEGRAYVQACIDAGPSRPVQARRGNTLVRFKTRKRDATLMLESRTGEFPAAVLMDRDPDIHAFYDQPQPVELFVTNQNGRVLSRLWYHPDFLVAHKSALIVREYRDEAALVERMAKNPYQFYLDAQANWHYRAAEEKFQKFGLRYEIISNRTLPANLVLNERFLEDYLRGDAPAVRPDITERLRSLVAQRRFVGFRELLDTHEFTADDIFKSVADEIVYVDLARDRLDATDDLHVFVDEVTCRAHQAVRASAQETPLPIPGQLLLRTGTKLIFGGKTFTVLLAGERDVSVRDEHGEISSLALETIRQMNGLKLLEGDGLTCTTDIKQLAHISSEELGRALERLNAVQQNDTSKTSARSLARYRQIVDCAGNDLDAVLALVDSQRLRGNRSARLAETVEELAQRAIEMRFNAPEKPPKKGAYAQYVALCEQWAQEKGEAVTPMSFSTFCKRCNDHESIPKREGKRAAYQKSVIAQVVEVVYPVHGVRPHEVCYIDHTVANLATVGPDGTELGKPTLTVAVDGNTAHPRALVLSYDPPSTWTVLLVLRDYVRRHGRLPRILSVDNGKEFHSKELELFARLYGIDIRYRAPGMPRGGAMVERLLGATEQEVIAHMEGNTRQMKDPRLVTKSVNPFRRAVWTLTAAYFALEEYLFTIRPNRIHSALGMTPNEYEQRRLQETGARTHRLTAFDENLMLLTCPHAARKYHKVDPRRGIWADGQWYRHPDMDVLKKGEKVEVRVEPWSFSVIYVYVRDHWVAAVGSGSRAYAGRHRREVSIARRAERRRALDAANKDGLSRKVLKSTERLWTPEHYDPRINAQQREMKHLFTRLGMTTALPLPAEACMEAGLSAPASVASALPSTPLPATASAQAATPAADVSAVTNGEQWEDDTEFRKQGIFSNVPGYY